MSLKRYLKMAFPLTGMGTALGWILLKESIMGGILMIICIGLLMFLPETAEVVKLADTDLVKKSEPE